MKANKFFAVALAVLTLVGFNACKEKNTPTGDEGGSGEETALSLDQTSLSLEVGGTATILATVEATWASSNTEAATVAGDGKSAVVTAVKEGNAVITATTKGGQTKTCVVAVKKAGGQGGEVAQLKGSQVWPIVLDGVTLEANESKVVSLFSPDDVTRFLYYWDQTYTTGSPSGLNFHGNNEGYQALVVGGANWAGAGWCLTESGDDWKAAEALRAAIVENPDDYFLHMAIKSTDNGSHCFYFMGSEATKFVLGANVVYDGPIYGNFTRDGSWAEFDIPMSTYASALASTTVEAGVNIFVVLSEGTSGVQLNLDAVYFYKK